MKSDELRTGTKSRVQHSLSADKHAFTQALVSLNLIFLAPLKILGIKIPYRSASRRVQSWHWLLGKMSEWKKEKCLRKEEKGLCKPQKWAQVRKEVNRPMGKKGENHFSLCQPEGNSLAAKGRTRSGARVPFGSGVPPRFYLRTMGSDQLGEPRTVHR